MTPPTARTQGARTIIRKFLDWFVDAPLYQSIWFIPFVAILYVVALIKNFVTGEK